MQIKFWKRNYRFTRPAGVFIDASTACQLKCPGCPNSAGKIKQSLGKGFLSFYHFRRFLEDNPWVRSITLSNWGEVLLNPELMDMLEYGYNHKLRLNFSTNLNTHDEKILKALVEFKVQGLNCSIDGASQETYATYRVNGDFDLVIRNIQIINVYKNLYSSELPELKWQFIPFAHNQNEISTARALAESLNMKFIVKLSWDDLYDKSFSSITDREIIMAETGLNVTDRKEYEAHYKKSYIENCCHGLWDSPRINYDGLLLGCCINYWGDYGNVFEQGLEKCFQSEKISYARSMLRGLKPAREDIPCSRCKVFATRVKYGSFVDVGHHFIR